ncbi:glycosyltransferase [Brevibacterium atlanticum]|uniref:glycosyltransferase n=1 Tax=Brevibacterium atlanticum TaxID=2697563 RepID=UPI0014209A27|nr:glycosyltransferase [Brevibacterium atlanticum]
MRISVLSLHTSPAAQPGQGDAGGMNVYVDQSVRALAEAGHRVDVFTADPGGLDGSGGNDGDRVSTGTGADVGTGDDNGTGGHDSTRMEIAESITLHHLPTDAMTKDELADAIDELAQLLNDHPDFRAAEFIWAHYWISAEAALRAREITAESSLAPSEPAHADRAFEPDRVRVPIAVSMHTIGAVKNRDSETNHERPQRLQAEERIAAEADLLVAGTPVERRDLISEVGAEPDSVVIARPGVDHTLYRPGEKSAARQRLGFGDDEAIVLYVGRMQFIKGTDVAVDALAELRERDPHLASRTRGILLGAASGVDPRTPAGAGGRPATVSSTYLRSLTSAIAAEPSVEVRLPVPAHVLVDYYRAADVLIVPSRSESFGLVAAEAASSGLPAIASAVGGLPEIVEHGHSGLLIADHNPRHWATAIETLLRDEELRRELGAHAVDRAERFDWGCTVAAVLDVLPDPDAVTAHKATADAGSRPRSAALGAY